MSVVVPQPFQPGHLDDELAVLTLQLEEIALFSQGGKGKHRVDQPPDIDVAFANFQAELQAYKTFLDDQKLAQSIAAAVHSDSILIGEFTSQDVQAHEDRRFALELSNNDPEIEAPPPSTHGSLQDDVHDWMSTVTGNNAAASIIDFSDEEMEAGPSMSFTERQADTMRKLSMKLRCTACTDRFPRAAMVTTPCKDRYCIDCIKTLFMKSTKDESLYPPKCCKEVIPPALVTKHMDLEELAVFELATVEYATRDKTYCSNHECAKFILPGTIASGTNRATCPACGTDTCTICKNASHQGTDCPDDPSIGQTRQLAREMGWQTCFACDRVVELWTGCNHMT
jgi:hypothetical protein